MAKKLTFSQQKVNFLTITVQSVNWLISNFEYGKICRIGGLFAKAVFENKLVNLGENLPMIRKCSNRTYLYGRTRPYGLSDKMNLCTTTGPKWAACPTAADVPSPVERRSSRNSAEAIRFGVRSIVFRIRLWWPLRKPAYGEATAGLTGHREQEIAGGWFLIECSSRWFGPVFFFA